jgi:hypothetical protein
MMENIDDLKRWGVLLEVLSEMSDVERQVLVQAGHPGTFIPDELLARWHDTFQGGHGLLASGVSEVMAAILLDFDFNLDQLVDVVPDDADDKIIYIQHDSVWAAIRDLADWTVVRIAEQSMPEEPIFGLN